MIDRPYIVAWCCLSFASILISSGFGLFLITKNVNMTCIKNRQAKAHSCWIITITIEAIAWTVVLIITELNIVQPRTRFYIMVATMVVNYINWAFFLHRIWMLFYKSLQQKSLTDFNIFDEEARRTSKSLSNFWVTQRHRLGDSKFMSVIWFIFWCSLSVLLMYLSLECGVVCLTAKYNPPYDLLNELVAGFLVLFGLFMLGVQKLFTVSDSFSISTELLWKCFVLATFFPFYGLLLHTDAITSMNPVDKIIYALLLIISMLLLQLLITDYYLWNTTSRVKNLCIDLDNSINMNLVLKNKQLFLEFEKQLKQEFSIQHLNFLVSCIRYRRMSTFLGDFGIESSTSGAESDRETSEWLQWTESIKSQIVDNSESNPSNMARFIFYEYFGREAPQKINLSEETARTLSNKIENLSDIYDYAERNLFCEAFDYIFDFLSKDALERFKTHITTLCVDNRWRTDYEQPLI